MAIKYAKAPFWRKYFIAYYLGRSINYIYYPKYYLHEC